MKVVPTCPHCGKTNEVYRHVRAFGWCVEQFDEFGRVVEIQTDGLNFSRGNRFRCAVCDRIRKDLENFPYEEN